MTSPVVPTAIFSLGSGGKSIEIYPKQDTIIFEIVQPTSTPGKKWTMRLNLFQYRKLVSLNDQIQRVIKKIEKEQQEEKEKKWKQNEEKLEKGASTSKKSKKGVYSNIFSFIID